MSYNGNNNNNSFPRKRGFGPRGAHGKGIFRSRFLHPPLRHVAPPPRHGQPRPLGWKLNNVFYPPFRGNPKFRPHNGRGRGIGNIRFPPPPPHRLPAPQNYMFEDDIILDDNEESHVNSTPLLPLPGSEEERQLKITEAADRLKQKLSFSKDKEHNIQNDEDVPDPLDDDCLRNNQSDFDVTCNDLTDIRNINPDNLRPDIIQHHDAEAEELADCRRNDVTLNENEHGSQLEEANDQVRNLEDFSGYEVIDRWECDESVDNSCNLEQSTLYQESNIVESRSLDLNLQCQYDVSLTDNVQDQCNQQQDISQDVSHEVPQDILQDVSQDIPQDIPQDIHSQNVFCQDVNQDTFQNVSEENEVHPTDAVIEQNESETLNVQEVSFLPNPIDQNILQNEQEEPAPNPEDREDAPSFSVYPEKSDNDCALPDCTLPDCTLPDCTLPDCTLPQSAQVDISVLNDVTLDNQSPEIHENSFHSGPPNLSPPVDTAELELPADFDPTTPPPILLKQDQPHALPLPLELPPLFNPAEPPPNMRHLIGPTTSPCDNMNHPWNINNQNPIPYNTELNVHVGFTSPMSFEMASPNNVYLSPIVGANNFSSFVPMMPNNHPVINTNIPPVMQPHGMQMAPQLQVVPFAHLTEPSVPPPPPEDSSSKDDGLNDMEEAMKFAEQMTILTASKPERSESSSLIESSSVNVISNIETIELPPEKPKTKSKKLKRKTLDDTKVPEEKTPSKHLPSIETTTLDATERAKDTSLIPDDHRPKVVFNLNNTSKLVRSTVTRQQESVNETANNRKSSIQSVESKRAQSRPSASDRNLENTRQNKESNRNSKKPENKPDVSKVTASPSVVSPRKKKQENAYAEKPSGVTSGSSLKSRVADQDESNKSSISDVAWKNKVINRLLKMSTNEIYNLVNNTSLRKFNVVMKRLVKEKKSTLSLEKRHEQDEKMKMYDRQEFMKHLNAMLDTDAVVSVTDLPTEFIQHLNEVLQMNMQHTDFQAEPAAAAATSGGQSGHSDAANYVSNPPARVAEHAVNRTALSVNDVGQECARIKSDAKTRYSARGAKARNCKSNNSTNLRIDTPPNSSSARTHAIKNNDVTSTTRTDVAAARVQDVIRNNNNVNLQQNDTSSVVASSSDSICNNLLSLQHDVDDIFSEVTKKYQQQPAEKKKRARCSTSDDGTIFVRAQDNIFEQSLTRNTENCIRWLEGCDRWKRKEREEPRYRNLTREEWLAKYGTQANPPSSPVTTTTSTTTTLPTTTLSTTATDTARFAQLSKQQTKKYPLQRRYSSESLRFNARQSRSLERDKQTQPRRHSDERRQVARECSENDRGDNNNSSSSSSSSDSSDTGKSNDNNNTNVAKLLRVIKEKEKVAKKRSLNEQMRDEINAEIAQERKKKAKKSRKKNSKHRREKRLRHKKKKTKKTRSFTTSSGSDGDSDAEELPTRLLTADEIKKEMDDQQVTPQQVMIKEEVDIGQDENIETAFANAAVSGNAIPISENRATCLSSSRNSRFDSPATRENPAVTINTVQLLVAEDRRLQTTPASPTTKTKAQLKQMPETSYRNEGGKIRPNVFTSVPRDTISAANLAANLDRSCPAPPAPVVCDDNNKIDAPTTSIANPVGRDPDDNAQEPVKNATEKLLLPEARDRRDEKHEQAPTTSESPTAAINAEDDNNKKCQPTISVSTADVSSAEARSTVVVSMDASAADAASQKSSKKIDLKTYYERTIRRRISEQSKKRNVKNESSENPNAETSQLSAATTIPQRDVPSKSKRSAPETKAAPTTAKKSKSPSDAKKFVNIRSEGSKELRLKRLSPIKKGKKKTSSKCASTNPVVSTDVNPPSQATETTGDATRTEDAEKTLGGEKEIDNVNHDNRVNSTNNNNVNDNVDKVEVTASNIDSSVAINELSTTNCLEKNIDNIDDRKLSRNSDEDKPEECSETNKETNPVEQRNVDDAGDIENSDTREQVTAFAETAMREEKKTTRAGNAAASGGEVADGETRKDDDASFPTTTTEPNVSKPPQKYPRKLKRRNFIPSSQIEKSNNQADTTENKNATTPPPRSTRDIDSQNKENRELTSASATSNINNNEVGNAKSPIISKDATTCKPASKNETNSLLKKAIKMSINSSENNLQEHHQGATSAENEISSPESLASNPFKGFLQEPVMDFEQSGLFNFSLNEIDADKSKLFLHENSINSIVTQTVNSTMMKLEQPRENYDEMPTDYTEDVDIGTGENFNIGFGDTLLAADKECAAGTEKPDALTDADECGEEEPAIKSPSEIVVGAASLHDEENNDANSSSETEKQLALKECLSTTSMFANDVENDEELIRDASGIKNLKSKLKTATDPSLSDALDTAAVSDDNMRLTETQSADHLNNPMYLETDASSEKTCDKLPDFDSDAQLDNMFYLDERLPSATEFDNKDDASYPVHPPSPPQYGLVPAVIPPEMTTITSCGGMLSPDEVRKTERYNLKPADNDLMIGAPAAGHSPAGAEETRTSSVIPTKAALKEVATNDFPRSPPSNLSAERAALEIFEKGGTSGGEEEEEEEEDAAPNYQTSALPAWHVSETNTDTRETHNNTDFVNINMVSSTGNRDKIDECARKKTGVNTASESTPTLSVNVVADKLFNLQRKPVVELTKMKEVESLLQKKVVGRHEKKCGSKEQREERHKRAADSALHRLKDKLSMKNRSEKTSEDNLLKKLKDMIRKSKTRGTNVRETILARMLEIDMKMHNLMLEKLKLHELLHDKNVLTMGVNDASHSVANNTASVTPVTRENNNNNNNNAASVQSGTSPARPIIQLPPNAETTTNRAKQDKHSSTSLSRRSSSKQRKRNVSHSSEEDEIANFAHKSKMPVIKWKKKPRLELNSSRRREDNNDDNNDENDSENKEKEKVDAKTERRVAVTSFSHKKAVDDPVDRSKNNNRVSESDSVLDRDARKAQEATAKTDDVEKPSTCAVSKTTQSDKTYADNRSDRQNSVERETEHMDVDKRSETRTPSECAKTSSRPSSRQVHSTPEPIYSDDSTWDSMVQNIVSETHENRKTISPLVLLDESLKKEMAKTRKMKAMMRKKKKKQLNNFLNSVNSLTEEEEELPLSTLYIRKLQQKRDLLDSLSDKKKDVDTKNRAKNVDDATNAAQTDKAPENPQEDSPPPPPPPSLPQPQEARAPDDISTSNVSSVLQPSHQFCIDAEANANSDWPSPEKENVGEVAPQDNNDANSSSDYVFRSVSQNRVTFQDERNMEPDSSVTPEDTLIEKHSTDNVESIENSRTRSGSIARDDCSKDRNKIPDIKVSVPKTLIDDDFSVRLLQKFKETETGVDSTSSSAPPASAEKVEEINKQSENISETETKLAENDKSEEAKDTGLIEDDKDKNDEDPAKDLGSAVEENNTCALQEKKTIDEGAKDVPPAVQLAKLDYSEPEKETSSTDSVESNEKIATTDAARAEHSHNTDAVMEKAEQKKSDAESEQSSNNAIASRRDDQITEIANAEQEERIDSDNIRASPEKIVSENSDDIVPADRASKKETNESTDTPVEPKSSLESPSASSLKETEKSEEMSKKLRRRHARSAPTRRSHRHISENVKLTRTNSTESSESKGKNSRRKRKHTEWQMMNCKVKVIDCKYTFLRPNVSSKLLEKYGIIHVNSYPSDSYKLPAQRAVSYGDHPALISEDDSSQSAFCDKDITELEILEERFIKKTDDINLVQEPTSHAAVNDDQCEPMRIQYTDHTGPILDIKVFENSFLAASEDGKIYRYSRTTDRILNIYKGHKSAVTCLHINTDAMNKKFVYSGSLDGNLRCYNIMTGEMVKNSVQINSPIQCMDEAWGLIFIGTKSGHVSRFNIKTGCVKGSSIQFSEMSVLALKATNEGPRRILIVASRSQPITIRDAQTGLFLRTISSQKNHTVYSLMRHQSLIYCGTSSTSINVFDFTTGEQTIQYKAGVGIVCMRLHKQLLFAGCYDGNIYIFDTRNHKLVCTIPGPGNMLLSIEVIDNKIIAGSKDKRLHLWQMPTEVCALL